MSEWVVLDITSFTKTTKTEKVLKILKDVSFHEKIDLILRQTLIFLGQGRCLQDHRPLPE